MVGTRILLVDACKLLDACDSIVEGGTGEDPGGELSRVTLVSDGVDEVELSGTVASED